MGSLTTVSTVRPIYIRDTKDLINAEVNVPAGTDFAEYVANIGSLKNTGFEFAINAKTHR